MRGGREGGERGKRGGSRGRIINGGKEGKGEGSSE